MKLSNLKSKLAYGLLYYLAQQAGSIPCYWLRHWVYRHLCGWRIGGHSNIQRGIRLFCLGGVTLGEYCCINRDVEIDGRRGVIIGNNVHLSVGCKILTLGHDIRSSAFRPIGGTVVIEDYVWIGAWAIIMPEVRLGRGCVIGAGSIVTKDVCALDIVVGNPAKVIGKRPDTMQYNIEYAPFLQ